MLPIKAPDLLREERDLHIETPNVIRTRYQLLPAASLRQSMAVCRVPIGQGYLAVSACAATRDSALGPIAIHQAPAVKANRGAGRYAIHSVEVDGPHSINHQVTEDATMGYGVSDFLAENHGATRLGNTAGRSIRPTAAAGRSCRLVDPRPKNRDRHDPQIGTRRERDDGAIVIGGKKRPNHTPNITVSRGDDSCQHRAMAKGFAGLTPAKDAPTYTCLHERQR